MFRNSRLLCELLFWLYQSSLFPVEKIDRRVCCFAVTTGKVNVVNFKYLIMQWELPPSPRQNFSVNKENQTWMIGSSFVRFSGKSLMVTQNTDPDLLSRHVPVFSDKGGWRFYSASGWYKKKRRARSSGQRRLRAGWAVGAWTALVVFDQWAPSPRTLLPLGPALPLPAAGGPRLEGPRTARQGKWTD